MGHGEGGSSGGAVRELLAIFGFGVDTHELEKGESKLAEFGEKVKHIGEGIAAAFAVEQLYEFAEGQVHAMTAVEHLAAQIGISTDEVQAWQFAAQSAGFESDKLLNAMSRLQVATANKNGAKAFSELGISLKDASGSAKEADQLFVDVAEAIKKTEDPNKRAAIATKLFGRAGRELIPFLEEGAEGIDELIESYHELGGAFGEKQIEQGKAFEKQQAKMTLVWRGVKAAVATTVIPVFTKLLSVVTPIIKAFRDLVAHSNIVKSTLVVLGSAATYFAVQMAIAAAPVLLIAAALAAVILLVDEVITLFQGGDTLIGDAIDELFGKGASTEMVKSLRDAWVEIKAAVKEAYDWVKKYGDEIKTVLSYLPPVWIKNHAGGAIDAAKASLHALQNWQRGGDFSLDDKDLQAMRLFAPGGAGGAGGKGGDAGKVEVNVNIDGQAIDHRVHKVVKAERREAAATVQRSGQP